MRRHDSSNRVIDKVLPITLLLCALAASCAASLTQPSAVVLEKPFDLRPEGVARLADGLEIRFDAVRSDSRCPANVQCIWAGDAEIAISVTPPAAEKVERELHTHLEPKETVVKDYTIKLISLVKPNDAYVATLTVSRK